MTVEIEARVLYTCYLSQEDEETVRQYAEEKQISLEEAVWRCYTRGRIHPYTNSTESDFSTEEIISVEE